MLPFARRSSLGKALIMAAPAAAAAQLSHIQGVRLGSELELVAPTVLRVCADPIADGMKQE
jgi:hypothetical protein